jgi:hypothetical protein
VGGERVELGAVAVAEELVELEGGGHGRVLLPFVRITGFKPVRGAFENAVAGRSAHRARVENP